MREPARDRPDHYEMLGTPRDASVEEIILGYRLLVRTILSHPELTGDDWNLGLAEQAFHTLSHADLRADYDRWLAAAEGRPPPVVKARAYLVAQGTAPGLAADVPAETMEPFEFRRLTPDPAEFRRLTPDPADGEPARLPPPMRALVRRQETLPTVVAETPRSAAAAALSESRSAEASAEERRALLRLRREGTIRGRLADGRTFVASLQDVSPKGLGFETALALEVGAEVWLKSDALFATAVVRNRRASSRDPAQHVVGVEFRRVHFRSPRGTFLSTTA